MYTQISLYNDFSENLDFAGGKGVLSRQLGAMKQCIEDFISTLYGLEVTVKEPEYAELNISKWQISIITSPNRKDLPKQRIKIEVANIPAYTTPGRDLGKKGHSLLF
ncbi:conserved hypothetical protein [Xenorhabdus bovienii str. feltiae Moldova]|uniref:Uncharacterized protein n=1 Tax=Xenorhabdus bovienii str. feltiae Moldova TaxID=1398200 RepID=A0A077NRU9_XENBV|nr:conserved hypothetical protein [Xenorhabdus bovienii str. feltiae Moldova]